MRPARRQGRDRARRRLRRSRRAKATAREARLREICAAHRHPRRRPVEPRRRRPAHQGDAHRQRRLRRAGPAGRPHLRRLAFRQHDRRAAVARQGARHRLCRPGLGRQRGRPVARRDLRSRRSTIPASTATCCFSKPCATRRRCAASRSRRPQRGKPILAYKLGRSAAARELAVSHTGALAGEDDVADVFLAECGIARVDTLDGLIEGLPLLARVPAATARRGADASAWSRPPAAAPPWWSIRWPAAASRSSRRAPRRWRASTAAGIEVKPARHRRPHARRRALRRDEGGARHSARPRRNSIWCWRWSARRRAFHPELAVKPIIDSAGAGKPLAAFLVPGAPEALATLSRGRRAELPHAGSLRRRDRRRAARGARRGRSPSDASCGAAPPATAACSTSSKPTRCSSASASRARRRSRSTPTSRKRRPCPFPIRSRSKCCRPRSRTRPTSAASCSACR